MIYESKKLNISHSLGGNKFSALYFILICTVFVYAVILAFKPVICFDIYFYLEAGRTFLQNEFHFFTTDPYLFTVTSAPLEVLHEWGSIVSLYILYLSGGWSALLLAKTIIILITISTPFVLARNLNYKSILIPAVATLSVYVFSFRFYLRTDLISTMFTMIILTFVLIVRGDRYQYRKAHWAIPLCFILWINLHPGFLLGLFFIGLALVVDAYPYLKGEKSEFKKDYLKFCYIYILSIFSCLINPQGIKGFFFPLELAFSKDTFILRQFIPEWHPTLHYLNFTHVRFFIIILLITLILVFISLAKNVYRKNEDKNILLYETALFLFFTYFGLSARRYIGISALGYTLLIVSIAAKLNIIPIKKHWTRFQLGLCCALMILLFLLIGVKIEDVSKKITSDSNPFHLSQSPEKLADFIEMKKYDTTKIYNHVRLGSYFLWKWHGKKKIFIHSFIRDTIFFEKDYISAQLSQSGFDSVINKYDIRVIILPPHILQIFKIGEILKNNPYWNITYEDHLAVVYERDKK